VISVYKSGPTTTTNTVVYTCGLAPIGQWPLLSRYVLASTGYAPVSKMPARLMAFELHYSETKSDNKIICSRRRGIAATQHPTGGARVIGCAAYPCPPPNHPFSPARPDSQSLLTSFPFSLEFSVDMAIIWYHTHLDRQPRAGLREDCNHLGQYHLGISVPANPHVQ
jgi:hypothetical protein